MTEERAGGRPFIYLTCIIKTYGHKQERDELRAVRPDELHPEDHHDSFSDKFIFYTIIIIVSSQVALLITRAINSELLKEQQHSQI
jgi:hypothetical protein